MAIADYELATAKILRSLQVIYINMQNLVAFAHINGMQSIHLQATRKRKNSKINFFLTFQQLLINSQFNRY